MRLALLTSASSTTKPSTNSSSTTTAAAAEATDYANDGKNGPQRIRQLLFWIVQRIFSPIYVGIVIVFFVFILSLLVFVLFVVITVYLTIVIFRLKITKDRVRKRREFPKNIVFNIVIVPAIGADTFSYDLVDQSEREQIEAFF